VGDELPRPRSLTSDALTVMCERPGGRPVRV
jgi:hypothetical protein